MYPRSGMEQVLEYTIPVAHPLAIHFPIVLLVLAAVVVAGWLLRDRPSWLAVAIPVQAAGVVAGIVALRTGEAMADQSEGVPIVERLLPVHESWAEWTVWAAGLLLVLLVASAVWHRRATDRPGLPLWWRLVVAVAAVAVAVMVLWTGHVGGVMTWGVAR